MKIKSKLIVGFTLILLLMVVITSLSFERMNRLNETLSHFYDNRFEKVRVALSIRGEVNAAARVINDLVLGDGDPEDGIAEITERLTDAGEQFTQFIGIPQSATEQQQINEIRELSEGYLKSLQAFIKLVQEDNLDAAEQMYTADLRLSQRGVIDSLEKLVQLQESYLSEEMAASKKLYADSVRVVALFTLVGLLLGVGIVLWVLPSITRGFALLGRMADRFVKGRLRGFSRIEVHSTDELGALANLFKKIAIDLQAKNEREAELYALQQRQARKDAQLVRITELLQEVSDVQIVSQAFVTEFAPVLGASYGLVYLQGQSPQSPAVLELAGAYAGPGGEARGREAIAYGEGIVGQCFKDGKRIVVRDLPVNYMQISSGLGGVTPAVVVAQPICFNDVSIGVLELAFLAGNDTNDYDLLDSLTEKFATILNSIYARLRVEELLRESQAMTEELQSQSEELICQQEELRETNDKLEDQRSVLKLSEQRLQEQQEQLEQTNRELIVKTDALEEHVGRVETQNKQIALANSELERQAIQLAMSSKYKTEFLANMSHELRTPLNSLLILSEFLAENKEGNLTEKQREYMRTIHYSGNDLLKMIDEILDLSKVDAGKMDIHPEWMVVGDISAFLDHMYAPVAAQKELEFRIEQEEGAPDAVLTDGHRLKQILRNLISNAIKFTEKGSVVLTVRAPDKEELPASADPARKYVAFAVGDTGIGIAADKSDLIFEAFQQADGTTSRKYGGTGLGLTISRELAKLLGGWIHLRTEVGQGSVFTLVIPERIEQPAAGGEDPYGDYRAELAAASTASVFGSGATPFALNDEATRERSVLNVVPKAERPADDRYELSDKDKILLIVEDDVHFAKVLLEMAHSRGFKAVLAFQGDEGIELAKSLKPDAIILDIQLPVTDGWSVLNKLKSDPETRHMPVHVISIMAETSQGLKMGAIDHLQKPATGEQLDQVFTSINRVLERTPKQLMLIVRDDEMRQNLHKLITFDDVEVTGIADAETGWQRLQREAFDCVVIDSALPNEEGVVFLERIRQSPHLRRIPIIMHGGSERGDGDTVKRIRQIADSIVLKDVKSPERLLEETALFLHRVEADLPEDKRKLLNKLNSGEETFANKKILLVDDDVRNVFALSSVLENRRMKVVFAENGREALEKLESEPGIELVLMDIMMPEMDGYEAMRRIRASDKWRKLPVIALTAKAMRDDRNKCIEAGASDYITKPVNTDQLLSLMRVWLYR